jgi:hypothetical protein
MMKIAMVVWFVALIVMPGAMLLRWWLYAKLHRQRMRELEAIDGIVEKASQARSTEAYEYYMVEATRRLTEFAKKYP